MQITSREQHQFQKQIFEYFIKKNDSVQITGNQTIVVSGKDKGLAFTFTDNSCNIRFNEFSLDTDITADFCIDTFVAVLANHNFIYYDE